MSTRPGISSSVRKHGTFIYEASATINDYGSPELVAQAMQRAQMTHAWIRIHGTNKYSAAEKKVIQALIDGLKQAGINVAGWGWCQGANINADIKLAIGETAGFGLTDYLADIENGVNNAVWDTGEIDKFCSEVRKGISGTFGITTFPLIDVHEPQLMTAEIPYVDLFAPQVYWFNFPNSKMVKQFQRPNGKPYQTGDPAEYTELCLDRWDKLLGNSGKKLVLTGQAYWGESGFSKQAAEEKLESFLQNWSRFNRVIGLNWWHFGGSEAMSHRMLEAIVAAKLGEKPFAT